LIHTDFLVKAGTCASEDRIMKTYKVAHPVEGAAVVVRAAIIAGLQRKVPIASE